MMRSCVYVDGGFQDCRYCGIATQQAVFVHHQHAQPVAGFEQLGRRRIVRGAIGIAAHLLERAMRKYWTWSVALAAPTPAWS